MSALTRARVTTALTVALALPPIGSWFGADKLKHFLMSALVQSAAFSTARAAGADRSASNVVGAVSSAVIGVSKEVRDRRAGKPFSAQDLAWDAAGAGAMATLLKRTK